jgi:4'-phosphopantetheinyl transferase
MASSSAPAALPLRVHRARRLGVHRVDNDVRKPNARPARSRGRPLQWHVPLDAAVPRLVATSGDARIWLVDLDGTGADPAAALALLSDDEQVRAERFVLEVHRRRFVTGRAALRALLGARLGCPPRQLHFDYGPAGKPALSGGGDTRFNLSHSDRYALVAVATGAELGVDIERVRALRDMDLVAERVFSAGEREALGEIAPDRKAEAFFAGWTRKEAYIKARGEGIGLLGAVEVVLAPGDAPRLIRVAGLPDEAERWSIGAFCPVPGFAAAVCIEGRGRFWDSV